MRILDKLSRTSFSISSVVSYGILVILLMAGFGLRMIDLTDQPLDFHPYRQLHAAIIARGMYAQMLTERSNAPTSMQDSKWAGLTPANIDPVKAQTAVELWHKMEIFEPQILERLVAVTYWLMGAEVLWVARVYTSLFWVLGGLALFLLSRRATSFQGGLVALIFYLFLPIGVIASRSFQPDPVMVSLVLWAAYAAYCWGEGKTWRWAILTGAFSGLAVMIKAPAACQIGFLLIFTVLVVWGLKQAIRQPQVWVTAAITVIIPASYYLIQRGSSSSDYMQFWMGSFIKMLLEPAFYVRWLDFVGNNIVETSLFFISLASALLLSRREKAIAFGLWAGYALMGMMLPALIVSHNYYNLPLIPAAAFSLAPLAAPIGQILSRQHRVWQAAFYAVVVVAIAYTAWNSRVTLVADDYDQESLGWQVIAQKLPTDGAIIGITHDYGTRLEYYGWISVGTWPSASDQNLTTLRGGNLGDFASMFTRLTEGYDYFLITLPNELNTQPQLAELLYNNYPLLTDEQDYLLFDLTPNH